MDDQEREYILENARRMELLEETPAAPSGRCSDMTEVEKEKLIDYLFDQNDKLNAQLTGVREELRLQREQSAERHRGLTAQLNRMEERAVAAEKRADAAEKRAETESMARMESDKRAAELTAALTAALNGSVLKGMQEKVAKAEKERDDAKASDKQNRAERYGSTSQRLRKSDRTEDDDDDRDAGEEKSDMGAPDGVKPLPHGTDKDDSADPWAHAHYESTRPNRQGQSNNTMEAREMIVHESDASWELYELERHYAKLKLPPDEIKIRRNDEKTSEIIIRLRSKIDALKADGHPPRGELMDKAIGYLDSFWKQIMAYRNNGRYSIDNNMAERFMKPLANERKNSYFYGSDRMANVSAV